MLDLSLAVPGHDLPGSGVAVGELLDRERLAVSLLPDAVLVAVMQDGLAVVEPGQLGLGHAVVSHRQLNLATWQLWRSKGLREWLKLSPSVYTFGGLS